MSISRRQQNERNQSSDDEENTNEDFKPKLRMLGRKNKFNSR
jgi:hypothetical protein